MHVLGQLPALVGATVVGVAAGGVAAGVAVVASVQSASATPAARAGFVTAGQGRLLHAVDCALSVGHCAVRGG